MPQSLRSILGKPRITKPRRPAATTTAAQQSPSKRAKTKKQDEPLYPDKFADLGILPILSEHEQLTLRDVVQAMRYIRSHIFTAAPSTGLSSTRMAEVLNYRASVPRIVTVGHINAVLRDAPSRVEREVVELVNRGMLRRVRVERRGGLGEALIEMDDLRDMLGGKEGGGNVVSESARRAFLRFLEKNPTAQMVLGEGDDGSRPSRSRTGADGSDAVGDDGEEEGEERIAGLQHNHIDELVRAGFLTSSTSTTGTPGSNTLQVRPEDRTTLTSIQHVSRFASGTVSAVGGQNAIHLSGGGGGGAPAQTSARRFDRGGFRVAVPGHGRYLKLADGAVDWVREALGRTKWGEGPEAWLRERFEGNGLYGMRWKDFWGVEWEWVLGQAVGLGVVEVFDTGSVGRGVRALGG
ncbi:hypothetical protein QQS21_007032 [Conoideocrella luteorostrata]|uniref:Serine-threonine protein kinase 19 n=1 Tax=Conoideocrella luteorostrata TaxID=1105319 RepID=A0AAJ0FZS9_9HYPO|nr:hypothetical protein QQS21_007032 [Conoideocrella luteorostrata]